MKTFMLPRRNTDAYWQKAEAEIITDTNIQCCVRNDSGMNGATNGIQSSRLSIRRVRPNFAAARATSGSVETSDASGACRSRWRRTEM